MRSARDAIHIPAIHTPTARPNVASSCTKLSAHTLSSDFKLAAEHLAGGDWDWCLRSPAENLQDFLQESGAFVRISIDVWGVGDESGRGGTGISEAKVREVIGALESRFPRLLVSLGWIMGVQGRVWPARLCVPDFADDGEDKSDGEGKGKEKARDEVEDEGQFKGYYLLSVSAREGMDKEGKRLMEGKLMTAVREFERGILEAREFVEASKNVWVVVDVVKRKGVLGMGLEIDRREWVAKRRQDPVSEQPKSSIEASAPSIGSPGPTFPTTQNSSTSKPSKQAKHKPTPLRPAHEIIARIKWDPDLEIGNYLIGYEDRFVGVKEMELGRWKSESTDEEFIPLHRVVWIRLKDRGGDAGGDGGTGDGEDGGGEDEDEDTDEGAVGEEGGGMRGAIVWDRRRKIDCFFGSGVGAG